MALAQVVRITSGSEILPFQPWPHQILAWRLARLHRDLLVLKARQLGMTEAFMLLLLWESIAFAVGDDLVVSLNEREAIFNLGKATSMYDSTPDWFKEAFPERKRNVEEFRIGHGRTSTGIVSLPASDNAGRGRNWRRALLDEFGRWENTDERVASIEPGIADTGSIIRSSTAKGFNNLHTRWAGAVDADVNPDLGNGSVRMFVGALARPGRDEAWVQRMRAGMEGKLGQQEYPLTPEEAFISSGGCIFDHDALTDLETYSVEPPRRRVIVSSSLRPALAVAERQVVDRVRRQKAMPRVNDSSVGLWRLWQEPRDDRDYLIAADPCGGGGGQDYAAAVILDVESWDEVACLHGRPEPAQLAEQLALMGIVYGGRHGFALLAPEANNTGAAVIALLVEWAYPRILQTEVFDQRAQMKRMQLGWLTTAKTRPVAIGSLQDAVRTGEAGIRNAEAVAEMRRFEDPGNGRPEAADGAHDDLVLTWAIGVAVLGRIKPQPRRTPPDHIDEYVPRVSARTGY